MSALRGFEAAGRLGSFSAAAEELAMTQSAISHQIKILEDFLEQPLFTRVNRSVVLTDAGHDFLTTVKTCLDLLEDGVQHLDHFRKPGQIIISVSHAIATCWLLPLLTRFRTAHPDLDIWLHTSPQMLDFERGEVCVTIWLGDGNWPGLEAVKLFDEELVPLCTPALLAGGSPVNSPKDLLQYTLLHDERREDWRAWFNHLQAEVTPPVTGPNFNDSGILLQAAVAGQGIALGSRLLAAEDLASGRLVIAFDVPLRSKQSYYLITANSHLARPSVRLFKDWLVEQAHLQREILLRESCDAIPLETRAGRRRSGKPPKNGPVSL